MDKDLEKKEEPTVDPKEQELETLKARLAEFEADKKKAIEKREAEKQKAREEAERNGKLEEALNLVKDQLKAVQEKYQGIDIEELQVTKDKYTRLVESQKKSLLEKFPEDKRERFKTYELEQLYDIAQMIELDVNIPSVESKKKGVPVGGTPKSWNDMSQKEQEDLYEADPVKAKKLLQEYMANKKK